MTVLRSSTSVWGFLNRFRENGYVDAVISAKEIAAELGIEPIFPEKGIRKRKRVFRMSLLRKCKRHLKKPLREKFFIH